MLRCVYRDVLADGELHAKGESRAMAWDASAQTATIPSKLASPRREGDALLLLVLMCLVTACHHGKGALSPNCHQHGHDGWRRCAFAVVCSARCGVLALRQVMRRAWRLMYSREMLLAPVIIMLSISSNHLSSHALNVTLPTRCSQLVRSRPYKKIMRMRTCMLTYCTHPTFLSALASAGRPECTVLNFHPITMCAWL